MMSEKMVNSFGQEVDEYGRTKEEQKIFSQGLEILSEHMGDTDAEAFIALISRNKFNYTEWRRDNLFKGMTPEEIRAGAIEYAKTHKLD